MQINDQGVLAGSVMDYVAPSHFAQKALYYTQHYGRFVCDRRYQTQRQFLDAFLVLYVQKGELTLETRGLEWQVTERQIAVIDCKYAHRYACQTQVDFLWFHFAGCSSQAYYDLLFEQQKVVFDASSHSHLKAHFDAIYLAQQRLDYREHEVSSHIHGLLSQLAMEQPLVRGKRSIKATVEYIHGHYSEGLTVEQLAKASCMSVSQFIRAFKQYAGTTPHDYLLSFRLRQAKHFLTLTGDSIDSIADRCGFSSSSHFTRAFRKAHNMTPSQFRGRH